MKILFIEFGVKRSSTLDIKVAIWFPSKIYDWKDDNMAGVMTLQGRIAPQPPLGDTRFVEVRFWKKMLREPGLNL